MKLDVDHYLVLGVPRNADAAVIRAAYVGLAKLYHPDVAVGDMELATANFRLIREAYDTLSDPARRAAYDIRARQVERALAAAMPSDARARQIAPAYRDGGYGGWSWRGIALVAAAFLLAGGFLTARNLMSTRSGVEAASDGDTRPRHDTREPAKASPSELAAIARGGQASQPGGPRQAALGPLGGATDAGLSRTARLEMPTGQAHCVADDGTKFIIFNRAGEPSVAYNGDPAVRASIQHAGKHLLLLTNVVPNDSVIIGVLRGDEAGALVFHADGQGNLSRTVAAKCVGLAY